MIIFAYLLRRKLLAAKNRVLSLGAWEWARNIAFGCMGLWMLSGLYYGFWRLLRYLNQVQLIGALLIWKLTAMTMLTTFSMVILSGLIISLTTLFYSRDLRLLMRSPVPMRTLFLDKSIEVAFFSSWMIALVVFPYILALARVQGYGWGFHGVFLCLLAPFLLMAASFGMAFTMLLMYSFPSSATRDVVWILSSFSLALLYVLFRLSQPERLVRPDMLEKVTEYLRFLQAPTAPYVPSWWLTQAMVAYANGKAALFWKNALFLASGAAGSYGLVYWLSGKIYARGYSGAQEGRLIRRGTDIPPTPEARFSSWLGRGRQAGLLFWKERKTFFRDVSHWSQIVLIGALACVYIFSIQRLPLDTPDLKSLVCFLNIGIAGFVLSSLCLRFTFPSVSLEGGSFWVIKSAPVEIGSLMWGKFFFSVVPITGLATLLVAVSNHLLLADRFIAWLTLTTIWLMAFVLCGMAVGLGAMFPRFRVENIHQIESSAGGFVYMACALGYVGATLAAEAWPVQMHFQEHLGRLRPWDWRAVVACALLLGGLNAAAFALPWFLGRSNLRGYEGD